MVDVQIIGLLYVQDLVDLCNRIEICQLVVLQQVVQLCSLDLALAVRQSRYLILWKVRVYDLRVRRNLPPFWSPAL